MAGGLAVFMHAERLQESGDNYTAINPNSGAAGAYQFLFSTWQYALRLAGLQYTSWYNVSPARAPASVQDAAAAALMGLYYNSYGHSWYNVAEAWYGGPGAVGHPGWGGGPGYPNVGQYASQVMAKYNQLSGGQGGGTQPAAPDVSPFSAGFVSSYVSFFINVIEPVGKQWRANSRGYGPVFYHYPGRVA
jgi:transglycosylase-like protein